MFSLDCFHRMRAKSPCRRKRLVGLRRRKKFFGGLRADVAPMPWLVTDALRVVFRERQLESESGRVFLQPSERPRVFKRRVHVRLRRRLLPEIQGPSGMVFGMPRRGHPSRRFFFGSIPSTGTAEKNFLVGDGPEPRNGDEPDPLGGGGGDHGPERFRRGRAKFHHAARRPVIARRRQLRRRGFPIPPMSLFLRRRGGQKRPAQEDPREYSGRFCLGGDIR